MNFCYQIEGIINIFQRLFVIFKLQIAFADELQGFDVVDVGFGRSAAFLNIFSPIEDFQCILITRDFEIATAQGGEHVRVI